MPPLLFELIQSSSSFLTCTYDKLLFKAMFLLAFSAFLRVGEITISQQPLNTIHFNQIQFFPNIFSPTHFIITFKHYKHAKPTHLPKMLINKSSSSFCPVASLAAYCVLRGPQKGPLFISQQGNPVTRSCFSKIFASKLII